MTGLIGCCNLLDAQNTYYWVEGSGVWNDLSHWATTSGGTTKHTIVPSILDDVVFDANSFTGAGQTVTVNQEAYCMDFTWDGVTNNPGFVASGFNLNVDGNFQVSGGVFTYTHANGNLLVSGDFLVDGVDMSFNKSGGVFSVDGNLTLANNSMSFFRTSGSLIVGGAFTMQNLTPASFSASSASIDVAGDFLMDNAPFAFNPGSGAVSVGGNFSIVNGATNYTHSNTLTVGGSLTLNAACTFNQLSTVIFNATTTGKTITSAGKSFTNVRFDGAGGEWILQDDFKATGTTDHYTGIFRSNGHEVDYGQYFDGDDGGTVRTLDYTGTDTVRVQYQYRLNTSASTVLTMGSAVLLLRTTGAIEQIIEGGGKTFGNVVIDHLNNSTSSYYIRFRDNNTTYGDMSITFNNRSRIYLKTPATPLEMYRLRTPGLKT
ncbi:MAG: hypothetical protein R3D58_02395 [Saprospiraceae bacterium]